MVTELKSKQNFKNDAAELPMAHFLAKDDAEYFIKFRQNAYELPLYNVDTIYTTGQPGMLKLGRVKFEKMNFCTRMIFTECSYDLLHSNHCFKRWIKIRDLILIDAMLFISADGKIYRLSNEHGPVHIPLSNTDYYSLMRQLKA